MNTPDTKSRDLVAAMMVCVIAILLSSCYEIHSDTVLHPDGSLERAIDQPLAHTPLNVITSKVWMAARYDAESGFEKLDRRLNPSETEADEPPKQFVAWGRFDSFADVPDHFVLKAADGVREARLTRRFRHNDYGFIQEYLWEETATEIVTVADMKKARRDYSENWARLLLAFCEEYFGDDYDCSGIEKWLRNEADEWHEAFVDLEFDHKARQTRRFLPLDFGDEEAHEKAFAALCAHYGLELAGEDGAILEGEAMEEALRGFFRNILLITLRTREGEEVDPAALEMFLEDLAGFGESTAEEKAESSSPADLAWERASERVFASAGLTEDDQESLEQRLNGLQGGTFRFTMTVPGTVVETNGTLLGDHRVRWQFGGGQAFPYGFPMAIRSLSTDEALQLRLLSAKPLANRETLLNFLTLAANDGAFATALRKCVEEASTTPLSTLRKTIDALEDEKIRQARSKTLTKTETILGIRED